MPQNNEIELILTAKANEAIQQIGKVTDQVNKLTETVKSGNTKLEEQTKVLTKTSELTSSLTAKITALAGAYMSIAGATNFIEFMAKVEDGFVEMAKTTGASTEEMKKFSDGLYKMTETLHGISLTELQEIAAGAGQLGVKKDDILEFTKAIAKISVALNISADEASKDMAIIANVFNEPIENVTKLGSAINELSAGTAADVGSIIDITQRLAGVGAQFGLTADQVMAVAAAMKELGIRSEIGATAFGQVLMSMQTDTEKFAKAAGMQMTEFAQLLHDKPIEAIKKFFKALGESKNQAAQLKELGLTGAGVSQVVLGLANNTDKLSNALKIANAAYEEGTSIDQEFAKASDTIHAKQKDLTNAFVRLSKELTVKLTPAIKDALDALVEWIDGFDTEAIAEFATGLVDTGKSIADFVDENKALIKTVIEVGVAFKGLYKAFDLFAIAVGKTSFIELAKELSQVGSASQLLPALFGKMKLSLAGLAEKLVAMRVAAMAFATSPLGLAIIGITAAVTAGVYAYNKYTEAEEAHAAALKDTEDVIKSSTDALTKYADTVDNSGKVVITSKDAQDSLAASLGNALNKIKLQKQQLEDLDAEKYKTQIDELSAQETALTDALEKVVSVKEDDIQKNAEAVRSSEEYSAALQELSAAHRDAIDKIVADNEKRLSSAQSTLNALIAKEKDYEAQIKSIEERIQKTRTKYNNMRIGLEEDFESKIKAFRERDLTDYEKYVSRKGELEKVLDKARKAYASGNFELAKRYIQKYEKLVDEQANYEINNLGKVGKTKEQVYQEYESLLKNSHKLKIGMLETEEKKEQAANLAKLEGAKQQLEAIKLQIVAQKELVKLLGEIVSKAKGAKFEMDFTAVNAALKDVDKKIKAIEDKKRQVQFKANLDAADAKLKEQQFRKDAEKPIVSPQRVKTDAAIKDIGEVDKYAKQKPIVSPARVDTSDAAKDVERFVDTASSSAVIDVSFIVDDSEVQGIIDGLQQAPVDVPVNFVLGQIESVTSVYDALSQPITSTLTVIPDFTAVSSALAAIQAPTHSTHSIYPDANAVMQVINYIKRPTHSTHTIYVRTVKLSSEGGLAEDGIPRLATGGWLRRNGMLPGFGGGDKIKALLEAGEFVHNKYAVRAYGVDFMHAINSLAIPTNVVRSIMNSLKGFTTSTFQRREIARYATGGPAGSGSSVSVPPDAPITPVNIILGDKTFPMNAERSVAEALARYMQRFGGR